MNLVLYFDRIPLWGKFLTTLLVGMLIGLIVMIIVKPRLRTSIEGIEEFLKLRKRIYWVFFL